MLTVTPQNLILTQNVMAIAAKCDTGTKCGSIGAECGGIVDAKCDGFPAQGVMTFLAQGVMARIVITPELQLCST